MNRNVAAACLIVVALSGCSQPSPEDKLLDAVHQTSATGYEDSGVIVAAGMACEMGGMGPVAFIGPLTDKGLTNEEGTELLPAFREYCRTAYPSASAGAYATPAPTVTVTQAAPPPQQPAPTVQMGENQLLVSAFLSMMRSRPETQGVYAANTDAQLLEWGRGVCTVAEGFVAQGQTLEQAQNSTSLTYAASIATSMSQAGNMDVNELTRRTTATAFFVGASLPTFCPQLSPAS
ncbi:hypothetical protein SAMN06264364_14519 [Quadrisphaera granulorum]|uniref:Uncharacterized protein n=1 Tax=Quadrisphaera granulorum TaxID=317664 RepID=A0A315ZQC8_9ACTN|nr:hypothetical protein [Quadrisphaera granulorum]PWJ46864.1 hypothetical protein BXY45_14519 [Quadrisphaera granulorum]SZE99031.1 hypothetical protein SAMN06264364_14519 [Quadrisphaera granulorum]